MNLVSLMNRLVKLPTEYLFCEERIYSTHLQVFFILSQILILLVYKGKAAFVYDYLFNAKKIILFSLTGYPTQI